MRNHIQSLPEDAHGWFAGLRDPHIGLALRLIHGRPMEPWTLERVAREIGLSRSAFAERFGDKHCPKCQSLARAQWLENRALSDLADSRFDFAKFVDEVARRSALILTRQLSVL